MNSKNAFIPKLVSAFREGYHLADLKKDLLSGSIVGLIAIPLSIAFAIASGARPEQGILTAVVAGIIAASTSGSRFQITGPTGAFVILVGTTISKFGYQGLLFATFLAGLILIVAGLSKVGSVIKFIPYSVTVGFTGGIAILIASSQLPELLGISVASNHFGFFEKWGEILIHLPESSFYSASIGFLSIIVMLFWPRLKSPIPATLVVLFVTTIIVKLLALPCTTIGARFGTLEFSHLVPAFPSVELKMLPELVQAALAIAFLAGIESLLSAVVADGMSGRRHRSHMELVSQGLANLGSCLMGGLPATGAIARTAANIQSGAVSPISGITHAIVILIAILFLGPYIALIPLSALAGILMVIAYRMGEWHHFRTIFRCPAGDIAILLSTFFLTIVVDLLTAIEVGIVLATFITIYRVAESSGMKDLRQSIDEEEMPEDVAIAEALKEFKEIEVYEIYGSLFFAAMEKFILVLSRSEIKPKVLILRMRHVMTIDASGIRLLFDLFDRLKRNGTLMVISGISKSNTVYQALENAGLVRACGPENVLPNIGEALERGKMIIEKGIKA